MSIFNFLNLFSNGLNIEGSDESDLIFGSFGDDNIDGKGGDDLVFGLFGDDKIAGDLGNDSIFGGSGHDTTEGGDGEDDLFGGAGSDRVVGNKGDDKMFGGLGDDLLVWNNGDGSDLMVGGDGYDRTQVNFNTDLVNDDLQNKDVAEFSVTDNGVQFARIELNDQTERGLFQLDIRETEALETNFGGGDDKAVIVGAVLNAITLDLDGGEGIDTVDLSQAAEGVHVSLKEDALGASKIDNFENVIGSEFDDKIEGDRQDNVISGLGGVDEIFGRGGNDLLVANKGDDFVYGQAGDDMLVWNNGDGSDLLDGGRGEDTVQVNFDTDLVNDDLQNKDVAEFSTTNKGVQFARIELNDQTERGLFQLDIRKTEELETNFGDGDDKAVIVGDVLEQITLDLDGGDGVDTLDLSQLAAGATFDFELGNLTAGDSVESVELGPVVTNGIDGIDGLQGFQLFFDTAINFENVIGTEFDDFITGNDQDNVISGLGGVDQIFGGDGNDTLIANKGDDFVFGGYGDDDIVWNNGDGSDLFDGGEGDDLVQVNFDTDLVNDDLQNKDVAEFSTTDEGVQFARIELNDQTERGLFQLDIRDTETLETNFGDGDDKAVITGDVLDQIVLDLDGGDGVDTLDLSQADPGVFVDLNTNTVGTSTAVNFENVIGTIGNDAIFGNDEDNVIRGGGGQDIVEGGGGADTFVFVEDDDALVVIQDFEEGIDRIAFETTDPTVTADALLDQLVQDGDDVKLEVNGNEITFEDALVSDFGVDDFVFV